VSVEAHIDREVVPLGERVTLTVTVAGTGTAASPELPDLPDFAVFPAGTARNFSFVNGKMASSTVYTYILAPRREGTFDIPPIGVTEGKTRFLSLPLQIRVEPSSGAPTAPRATPPPPPRGRANPADARAVFVTAEAKPASAYVGEQITLIVRFYQGVRLIERPEYRPPATTGFWIEQLPGERTYYTEVRGRQYHVTEIHSALFPTQSGELTVGPAEVECVIEGNPFANPFGQFFGGIGGGERRTVKSEPFTVTARPIPTTGRPADWSGAVGKFRLEATLDPTRVRVGEAATLGLRLAGQGNIRAVADPAVPVVAGLRAFDSGGTVEDSREGGMVGGVRKLSRVLVAEASGSYIIPAIPYPVFRPDLGRYETIRTDPITLEVLEGGEPSSGMLSGPGPQLLTSQVGPNLRFNRLGDPALKRRAGPLWASTSFWLFQLIPVGGLGGAVLLARHRERVRVDQGYARHRRSAREAGRRLKDARTHLARGEPREFYGAVAQALLGYVGDRANLPAASLTPGEAQAELTRREIDPALVVAFTTCLERCDFGRFARENDGGREEVMAEAESLLRALPRAGF
jgi:hypothetical protein